MHDVLMPLLLICTLFIWYFGDYFRQKGKNLATKEDINKITDIAEKIRSEYLEKLERIKFELTVLHRKHDIVLEERISIYKEFQRQLVSFKKYCHRRHGDFVGGDFAPTSDEFDEEGNKSALTRLSELNDYKEENVIFISRNACNALDELQKHLGLMRNLELHLSEGRNALPEIVNSAPDAYANAASIIDGCLLALGNDLQLPDTLSMKPE